MTMACHTLNAGLGGGRLWQNANRSPVQMMSYLLETPEGKLVMIDGGYRCPEDAAHLKSILDSRGGKVDLWIITHGHDDHFGALLTLMEQNRCPEIGMLYMAFPPLDWFRTVENGNPYEPACAFCRQLTEHNIPTGTLTAGMTLSCGGLDIEVLRGGDYEGYSSVNDSCVVLRAHFPKRDVLFLGDLGCKAGQDFLSLCPPEKLRCDIVQMAHHGQDGVDRDFYAVVQPKICLYTAPDWLWDNRGGTGPFTTLITRGWMEELGAKLSCPIAFGDYVLE